MLNIRICGIAAGAALVLSLLLGLVNGARFPALLLRAAVFGAIFFALFCLIFWLVGQFVPELLSVSGGDDGRPPLSGQSSSGPVMGAFPSGDDGVDDDVDDIGGKVYGSAGADFGQGSPGLDQGAKEGYNMGGGGSAQTAGGVSAPQSGDDPMPDFDALSEAFSPNSDSGDTEQDVGLDVLDAPKGGSKKKDALKGDFNAKELAQAIQTVLKKDEKG